VIAISGMVDPTVEQNYGHAAKTISVVKVILLVKAYASEKCAEICWIFGRAA
jgi:hypothetical protein